MSTQKLTLIHLSVLPTGIWMIAGVLWFALPQGIPEAGVELGEAAAYIGPGLLTLAVLIALVALKLHAGTPERAAAAAGEGGVGEQALTAQHMLTLGVADAPAVLAIAAYPLLAQVELLIGAGLYALVMGLVLLPKPQLWLDEARRAASLQGMRRGT